MKEKLLALLVVSVMVASAFGAISFSATKVGAATATTLTLSSDNTNPRAGDTYTLSGRLTGSAGNGLAYKPIQVWYCFPGGAWQKSNTIYTDANGYYSTTTSSSKTVYLSTLFPGDNDYSYKWSPNVQINVRPVTTTLNLYGPTVAPYAGRPYDLSGYLRDSAGNALAYKPIEIWYVIQDGTGWHLSNTIYTNVNGYYSETTSSSKDITIEAKFPGVGSIGASASSNMNILVRPVTTTLTLSSSNMKPQAGQSYTLSGYLRDSAGNGLAYKPIGIRYAIPNVGWFFSNTIYTGSGGYYSTSTWSSQDITLETVFQADGSIGGSASNNVFINVWPW